MAVYLVTGTAGFIGSSVSRRLCADGHSVVGLDNLNDAYDVRLKEWRLEQLSGLSGFRFVRADIADPEDLQTVFADGSGFDAVINLAARAGVRYSIVNPRIYYETNLLGTLHLLECCEQFGVKKFVLASTSSLYGDSREQPLHEEMRTDHPVSPYAASKGAAESLCYASHHLTGLDVTVLRYFTVYGPAGRPDMSPLRFVRWTAEGEPVRIFGDGKQSRDFTYIDDIAEGTVAGLRPLGFEVINLGSDEPVALLELVSMIEERVGARARLEFSAAHGADVRRTWADISRARQLLEWTPRTSIAQGLGRLVEWYREQRQWMSQIDLGD